MLRHRTFLVAVLAAAAATFAPTQARTQWQVGPHLLIAFPQSDFANVSNVGGGLGVNVTHPLWGLSWLGLRGDFGYISFGSDQRGADLGGFFVLVQSRNESFRLSVGPQLMVKKKRFQVYGNTNVGVFNYRTVLTIPSYYTYPLTQTTDSLTRLGWGVGGGVMYSLGFGPWLDAGLQYLTIRNAVSSKINGTEIRSDANEFNLTLGVVFFLK